MKIEGSNIQLASEHYYKEEHKINERMEVWVGSNRRPGIQADSPGQRSSGAFSVSISRSAVQAYERNESQSSSKSQGLPDGTKLMQTKMILERLLGQKFELLNYQQDPSSLENPPEKGSESPENAPPQENTGGSGFGMIYERHEQYSEAEQTSFNARGTVRTQNGAEIEFDLKMSMDRAYVEERNISIRAGDAMVDPLVINFSGRPAALIAETTQFDLDGNGEAETVHKLAPHSAYLVYDKNGDGLATDGSELFGPSTGSGFEELAMYDQDTNGWIDENDAVYGQLSLWRQGETDTYQSLKDAGIGAIYLDHASTEFKLADSANQIQGEVKETGIYLEDSGQVGSIQEIALAVEA